jgi:hypothetical protein
MDVDAPSFHCLDVRMKFKIDKCDKKTIAIFGYISSNPGRFAGIKIKQN